MTNSNSRQLPLDLGHEPGFSRDDLIVSSANMAAVDMVDRWPAWISPVVIIAGPTGSGKTHLASVWRAEAAARVVDPRDIGAAVGESGPFLIDDIGLGTLDQSGLFHLINSVRQNGSTLLMTSRLWPANWKVTLPDLASRLKAATTVEIGEPDDALLSGVLYKLFADRQIAVDPSVIGFLVSHIERSLSTANRVVERLDRVALEKKSRITRALAASVITAFDEGQSVLDL
ncbi:DnaA regulatory inactivator HdaA [Phyllobacterium sp. 21LDTY02-6]|uniref:DnaA regulatory inactivator HdaA n=1 Tax=unclassified Phyllobacterium TaxID=2638441 RepID=UPI002020ADC2|nr:MULTISPECIES: DnaA regulatory inactivator HdaA [unclassified Phyllobacterium]MCO4319719.1 DnaA regulatory inactivator HdaA [Phyllobacterium sp. 21LDTY02-6]MCX8280461.1 DnaA regulatory inactivator HdaA [Phyllobacterium sp. 0TCS1.6C]MCX8295090.1 DnaA regulatory inactivator HdaA [Phyllobacterium sp. 0TCS1.6A]